MQLICREQKPNKLLAHFVWQLTACDEGVREGKGGHVEEEWVEGVGIIQSVWRLPVLLFGLSAHSEKCFLIIVLAFFRTLFLSHFRNIGASTIYLYI